MTGGRKAVYYAVRSAALADVKASLASLRRTNRRIPAFVHVAGACRPADRRDLRRLGATVIRSRARTTPPSLHKWLALADLDCARLLYVDARYAFRDDPDRLFARCRRHPLYVRPIPFADRTGEPTLDGALFDQLLVALGGPDRQPIPDTHALLFNRGSHRRVAEVLPALRRVERLLRKNELPNPCRDPSLAENLAASIALGCLPGFRVGLAPALGRTVAIGPRSGGFRAAPARAKACITTTVREPGPALRSFLRYHLELGFERIFVFFDDPDDPALPIAREFDRVTVMRRDPELRRRQEQQRLFSELAPLIDSEVMARQQLDVETAIGLALQRGLSWILHIDADEAFHTRKQPLDEHFLALSARGVELALYQNHEALPGTLEVGDPFREVTVFKGSAHSHAGDWTDSPLWRPRGYFLAYHNGKAAARLAPDLLPHGVHRFRGAARSLREVERAAPCILHYVNCGWSAFKRKYQLLGNFGDEGFGYRRIDFHLRARDSFRQGEAAARALYEQSVMLADRAAVARELKSGFLTRVRDVAELLGR